MLNSIHFGESALSQVALDLISISKILPVLKQSQDGYPRNTSLTVILRNLQRSHLKSCPQRQWVFGHCDKRASLLGNTLAEKALGRRMEVEFAVYFVGVVQFFIDCSGNLDFHRFSIMGKDSSNY